MCTAAGGFELLVFTNVDEYVSLAVDGDDTTDNGRDMVDEETGIGMVLELPSAKFGKLGLVDDGFW